jgi:UDP-N-acetyl-D-mannosaminuronic acid dehydrogenase
VFGLGYIGLPTSLMFAHEGYPVIGVDTNAETVEKLNNGETHIQEAGLQDYYRQVRAGKDFVATSEPCPADIFLISVPTPVTEDKTADLSYVRSVADTIGRLIRPGNMVILESTVPPRTCLDVIAPIIQQLSGLSYETDYDLVHCPERVIPGKILQELKENGRIIGGATRGAAERAAELYSSFVEGEIVLTDTVTAELVKLMENTYRDVNIALANEFHAVCTALGSDSCEAIDLANRHPRVNIHTPGIGVGGHCIAVDPWFIIESAPEQTQLLQTARKVNDQRPHQVASEVIEELGKLNAKSVAFFGLAYKPDVDDLREAPAVEIVRQVAQHDNLEVLVVEPYVDRLPADLSLPNVKLSSTPVAFADADVVVGLVAHREFKSLKLDGLRRKRVLDFVGMWR